MLAVLVPNESGFGMRSIRAKLGINDWSVNVDPSAMLAHGNILGCLEKEYRAKLDEVDRLQRITGLPVTSFALPSTASVVRHARLETWLSGFSAMPAHLPHYGAFFITATLDIHASTLTITASNEHDSTTTHPFAARNDAGCNALIDTLLSLRYTHQLKGASLT